jgi:hypothetical protein
LMWRGATPCKLVDSQRGFIDVPCGFQGQSGDRFVYRDTFEAGREITWQRKGKVLVPSGMEVMVRERGPKP